MKNRMLLLLLGSFLACTVHGAEEGKVSTEALILKELRAIRALLLKLEKETAELRKEVEALKGGAISRDKVEEEDEDEKRRALLESFLPFRRDRSKPAKALHAIKLPANPTEAQCREYIKEVLDTTRGRNTFSSRDPQIGMLKRLGSERVPLLVEALGNSPFPFHNEYYLLSALQLMVRDEHKQLILDNLAIIKDLVRIVIRNHWEHDARKILVTELKGRPDYLPTEWIYAVAELKDKDTYDDLIAYLGSGSNPSHTYRAIYTLPGIDMEGAVKKAWKMKKYGHGFERVDMAKIAVQYGHEDALACLILSLEDKSDSFSLRSLRANVLKHIPFHGTNEEILAWFTKNRDNLIFDKKTKKYLVKDQEPKKAKSEKLKL